jgi:hypothetical protein
MGLCRSRDHVVNVGVLPTAHSALGHDCDIRLEQNTMTVKRGKNGKRPCHPAEITRRLPVWEMVLQSAVTDILNPVAVQPAPDPK